MKSHHKIDFPKRRDIVDDFGQPQLHLAINYFFENQLSERGKEQKDLIRELDIPSSTYYRRKEGSSDTSFISRVAMVLAAWYDHEYGDNVGSKSLTKILNILLWAASHQTLDYDPLWPSISTTDEWTIGYTPSGSYIKKKYKDNTRKDSKREKIIKDYESGNKLTDALPESDKGVVEYTKLVSAVLGIDINWVCASTWTALMKAIREGDVDVIAPFIMKGPYRKHLSFSKKCIDLDGVASIIGLHSLPNLTNKETKKIRDSTGFSTNNYADLEGMLKKEEIRDNKIEDVLYGTEEDKHSFGEYGLTVSSKYDVEMIYIEEEISYHISRIFDIVYDNIKTKGVRDYDILIEHMFDKQDQTIRIIITEKDTCEDIKTMLEGESHKNVAMLNVREGLNKMTNESAFAVLDQEDTIVRKIDSAIDMVNKYYDKR